MRTHASQPLDRGDVEATLAVIEALDQLAVVTAVPNLTDEMIGAMRSANKDFAAAVKRNDIGRALTADDRLHSVIIDAAANPLLKKLIHQVHPQIHRIYYRKFSSLLGSQDSVDHHNRLIKLCADHDAEAAATLSAEHRRHLGGLIGELFRRRRVRALGLTESGYKFRRLPILVIADINEGCMHSTFSETQCGDESWNSCPAASARRVRSPKSWQRSSESRNRPRPDTCEYSEKTDSPPSAVKAPGVSMPSSQRHCKKWTNGSTDSGSSGAALSTHWPQNSHAGNDAARSGADLHNRILPTKETHNDRDREPGHQPHCGGAEHG